MNIYWKRFGHRGFSLVQLLISVGIMGGIGLVVVSQLTGSQKIEKKASFVQDVNFAASQIQKVLSDRASCTLTIRPDNMNSAKPAIIRGIANPQGRMAEPTQDTKKPILYREDDSISSKNTTTDPDKRSDAYIENIELVSDGPNNLIRVTFAYGTKLNLGSNNKIQKDFIVNMDESGQTCYTERTDLSEVIKSEACIAAGAVFVDGKCEFPNLPECVFATDSSQCPSGSFTYVDDILLGVKDNGKTGVQKVSRCCRSPRTPRPSIVSPPAQKERSCDLDPSKPECKTCPNPGANGCITCNHPELPTWSGPLCGQCSTGQNPVRICKRYCMNGYSDQDCNRWCGPTNTFWTEDCAPSCVPSATCAQIRSSTCSGSPAGQDECGSDCGSGTKSCSCTPQISCADKRADTCTGQDAGTDSCGNICGTGTKTCPCTIQVSCAEKKADTCIGQNAGKDNCLNECGTGTKTCTSCSPKVSCEEIKAATCIGQDAGRDSCDKECGTGTKTCTSCSPKVSCEEIKQNICVNQSAGKDSCEKECGSGSKPSVDGVWSEWSEWTLQEAGGSKLGRYRTCSEASCGNQSCDMSLSPQRQYRNCIASGAFCAIGGDANNCNECCSGESYNDPNFSSGTNFDIATRCR